MGRLWVRHAPESAATVRRTITSELTRAGASADAVFDAAVISSELVGNAIAHARATTSGGQLLVRWHVSQHAYTFSVTDGGAGEDEDEDTERPERVRVRRAQESDTSGRGLAIVSRMADAWGVTHGDDGSTTVWARRTFEPSTPSSVPPRGAPRTTRTSTPAHPADRSATATRVR